MSKSNTDACLNEYKNIAKEKNLIMMACVRMYMQTVQTVHALKNKDPRWWQSIA